MTRAVVPGEWLLSRLKGQAAGAPERYALCDTTEHTKVIPESTCRSRPALEAASSWGQRRDVADRRTGGEELDEHVPGHVEVAGVRHPHEMVVPGYRARVAAIDGGHDRGRRARR